MYYCKHSKDNGESSGNSMPFCYSCPYSNFLVKEVEVLCVNCSSDKTSYVETITMPCSKCGIPTSVPHQSSRCIEFLQLMIKQLTKDVQYEKNEQMRFRGLIACPGQGQ